jgi:Helix-turn-helix domain
MPTDLSSPTLLEMLERDTSYMADIKAIGAGGSAWLSVKQTAVYLDRSVRQVRRYQAEGKMPERKKCGRERRYLRSELEKIKSSLD